MNVNYFLLEKVFGYQMIPEVLQRKMGAALKMTQAELVLVPDPVLVQGQEHCRLLAGLHKYLQRQDNSWMAMFLFLRPRRFYNRCGLQLSYILDFRFFLILQR